MSDLTIKKHLRLTLLAASLAVLTACGGGTDTSTTTQATAPTENQGSGQGGGQGDSQGGAPKDESYITYLTNNHAAYSEAGTHRNPAAQFDDANLTLRWVIDAQTSEQAGNLKKHIEFMVNALEQGQHPRPWDKLFLMDAYLKQQHRYKTLVSLVNNQVVIDKTANDACTYLMLKTHAQGVSGKFFEGDIKVSFSNYADQVIASPSCVNDRDAIQTYIAQNIKDKPKGITLLTP
ncbi:MAG TPA: hypothetical protein ENO09_09475 [bacterium]|nr:hypothetical protein [bacterium]